jgi:hypothetical protein
MLSVAEDRFVVLDATLDLPVCEICGGERRVAQYQLTLKNGQIRTIRLSLLQRDHSHVTGFDRGWLCISCNTGLGHFKDNPVLLNRAALYLIEHGYEYEDLTKEERDLIRFKDIWKD